MKSLHTILLSAALGLGACTANQPIEFTPEQEPILESRVQARNVLVTQGMNGSLTIDAEINCEAWTYLVHRNQRGAVTGEEIIFEIGDTAIIYTSDFETIDGLLGESITIEQPNRHVSISPDFEGNWVGYLSGTDESLSEELGQGGVRELLDRYMQPARENFALARELLDIGNRIANTVVPSDYDEMVYALTWMPTPNEFKMVLVDGYRDMLRVTTDRGFTYLYGTPLLQITDQHGDIVFMSFHSYGASGDHMLISSRNTEIDELGGEVDYNHDVYSEGEADELLGRARQLHNEFFHYYAPRAQTEISRHFLSDYTRYMPRD